MIKVKYIKAEYLLYYQSANYQYLTIKVREDLNNKKTHCNYLIFNVLQTKAKRKGTHPSSSIALFIGFPDFQIKMVTIW